MDNTSEYQYLNITLRPFKKPVFEKKAKNENRKTVYFGITG
jgi:hypothetical protein